VVVKPHWLARQFVSDPMQLADLVEKGVELLLVDLGKVRPHAFATTSRTSALERDTFRNVWADLVCRLRLG
jgi:hypothetical protein